MDKRVKLGLILAGALALAIAGVIIFLSPWIAERRVAQPPALPTDVTPVGPTQPAVSGEVPKPTQPVAAPRAATTSSASNARVVENRARTTIERIGSGVSTDGFLGFDDVREYFTAAGRAELVVEQQQLRKDHPATGPLYTISTKVVSSAATTGTLGDATIVVTVEAIQRTETNGTSQSAGKRVLVTFLKQTDGSYLIDKLEWSDVVL